jgi:2-keto-4-pentenoate hydratase/2-oxohepta-3-ene-1,7-dioic acid hydratase in catechol pathway
MRLVTYVANGRESYGAVVDDEVLDLRGPGAPTDLASYLETHHRHWPVEESAQRLPLADVALLPPVPRPSKIFCVAVNFHEPARDGKPIPEYPLLFLRTPEAQVGTETPILKPAVSDMYDFEGELAVVIGRPGHKIPRDEAMEHVAGYSCFNDGSVRDWQKHSSQFTPGKNFHASGAFGPWLVTMDEVPDWRELALATRVNGVEKQSIGMAAMIFDIPWLIAYCSTFAPLRAGDVIVTGTPAGFGSSRTPPEFLKAGDVVEVEISGLGVLRNTVQQDVDPRQTLS